MTARTRAGFSGLWTVVAIVAIARGGDRRRRCVREALPLSNRRRVFASDEDHFLFGSTGTEAEHGIPVLDLARAAAHLSRAPAAPGRIRGAWDREQARPRDAGRIFEGHHRLSSRGHQLRRVPYGPVARTSRRSVDHRCRRGPRIRRARRSTVVS